MKQRFNGIAPETYRDQQRRLEQRAREIEKQLNTPPAPQPQLRPPPGTAMRMQGDCRLAINAYFTRRRAPPSPTSWVSVSCFA